MKYVIIVLAIVAPMFAFATSDKVQTVASVNLDQYLGKWYEIASIPHYFQKKCIKNTNAEYSMTDKGLIKVLNSCQTESGERNLAEARARVVDRSTNAKLEVTFVKVIGWIFLFGGDYWILDLGPDYSYAVVGDSTRKFAWILGRSASLRPEQLKAAEKSLKDNGYNTCDLLSSIQDSGYNQRMPLCEWIKTYK